MIDGAVSTSGVSFHDDDHVRVTARVEHHGGSDLLELVTIDERHDGAAGTAVEQGGNHVYHCVRDVPARADFSYEILDIERGVPVGGEQQHAAVNRKWSGHRCPCLSVWLWGCRCRISLDTIYDNSKNDKGRDGSFASVIYE